MFLVRIAYRYLTRHAWQTVLMIVGVTLGVAVAVSVDLANASALRGFELSTQAVAGNATHMISAGSLGLDEGVYTQLKRQGLGLAMAPEVTAYGTSPQLGGGLIQILGIDPFAEGPFDNYLTGSGTSGTLPASSLVDFLTKPGAVFISGQLATRYGLKEGDTLALEVGGRQEAAFIAGLVNPSDDLTRRILDTSILTDIATAQELAGKEGKLDSVRFIIPANQSTSLIAKIESLLPAGVKILPAGARTGTLESMTSAFRINLSALSLLALVVGLFLIYNTMTFSVVQRRPLFGMLRCLGVTRRQVFALVIVEALIVGLVGAFLGVLLGILMGQQTVRLVTRTINDLFFVLSVQEVRLPWSSVVKGILTGVVATVVVAAPPAWEAASVPPRTALSRSGLEKKAQQAVWLAAGLGLLTGVVGASLLLLANRSLDISFAGTAMVTVGFGMLSPAAAVLLARVITPVTGRLWGALGRMAPRNVVSSLSRTSIAVAALMVAVAVSIGVSLMIGSFRHTVILWLNEILTGDVYISAPTLTATQTSEPVDPQILDILQARPEIQYFYVLRAVTVDSPLGPIQISASSNPNVGAERLYMSLFVSPDAVNQELQKGAVVISEPLANRLGLSGKGGALTLNTATGERQFRIVGIYYDYSSSQGVVLMSRDIYRQYWLDDAITSIALHLKPGANADLLTQELQAATQKVQTLEIQPNQVLREDVLAIFDRTFAITGALQLLATVVAFVGVLSALLALELERQRELGILRALGLTARQIWSLLLLETGLLGSVAGLLSWPTGYCLALILVYIINRRSFGWTMQMLITPGPFLEASLVAVMAAILAGIYPAWRMGRTVAADSIRFE